MCCRVVDLVALTGGEVLLLPCADRCCQKCLLVVVMAIQRACGDSGRLGDVFQLHRVEASIDEQADGLLEDLLLSILRSALDDRDPGFHCDELPLLLHSPHQILPDAGSCRM
jgi:hypothetical protein